MQIVLPLDYQNLMTDGNYNCYISDWIDSQVVPVVSCTLTGLAFTVNNAFNGIVGTVNTSPFTFYGVVINDITNPMYAATTAAFTGLFMNTLNSSAIFTYSTNFGFSGIDITQGILTCSITASPSTTSTSAGMLVTVTPAIMIPYNTLLTIVLPKYWPSNAVNTTNILSSLSCQALLNVSSTIQCSMLTKPTSI